MNIVKTCILLLAYVLALLLVVQASSHEVKLVRDSFKSGSYYALGNVTWNKFNLTWSLAPLTREDAIQPITNAFQTWENATPFKFRRLETRRYPNTDVKIKFTNPIECEGLRIFRRAFACTYPSKGEIFFRQENFLWSQNGIDIETVALHEIGHVLGLKHSEVPSAVMWSTIGWKVTKRNLHDDDIAGIMALYNINNS